jgi:hypothetical protein
MRRRRAMRSQTLNVAGVLGTAAIIRSAGWRVKAKRAPRARR